MSAAATGFDVSRFRDWLAEATGEAAEVSVTPIRGGGSCEMFRIDRLGRAWVVRRAPLAAVSEPLIKSSVRPGSWRRWAQRESRCQRCWPAATTPPSWVLRSS